MKRRPSDVFWGGLLLTLLLWVLGWVAKPLVPVTQARFVADSISRDRADARRDSTLSRIDSRVGAIYCQQVAASIRGACR